MSSKYEVILSAQAVDALISLVESGEETTKLSGIYPHKPATIRISSEGRERLLTTLKDTLAQPLVEFPFVELNVSLNRALKSE